MDFKEFEHPLLIYVKIKSLPLSDSCAEGSSKLLHFVLQLCFDQLGI